MNILYISSVCAQSRFDRLVAKKHINGQFQNQKFHHLLIEGLIDSGKTAISVVSFYPINRVEGVKLSNEQEIEDGVYYVYPKYVNKPVLHHIIKFVQTYKSLNKLRRPDSIIVCNIMNFDECLAALVYRCFHKIRICAITADVPGITSGSGKNVGTWWKRMLRGMTYPLYKAMSSRYDAYMFLSQAMNDVVNPKDKPYIVVEGLADLSMQNTDNSLEGKYPKKTVMYAGGLHREYGIALLVEAFRKIKDQNVELHIYGKGNYENELTRVAEEDHRIKYLGTKPNAEIVAAQIKAHILINPRPTAAEFVKYSFPSKIMECMASGTPLLTTRIPSMPDEYYPHIFTFDEETVDGFHKTLQYTLSLSDEELHEKGRAAKEFILKEKNYKVQAAKLRSLLMKMSS